LGYHPYPFKAHIPESTQKGTVSVRGEGGESTNQSCPRFYSTDKAFLTVEKNLTKTKKTLKFIIYLRQGILLAGFVGEGELDGEGATEVWAALDADIAAEVLGDLAGQRQPQARAISSGGALGAVEAVEDVGYLSFGDTAAMVRDAYEGVAILAMEVKIHGFLSFGSARVL
jgi:hypothetical protein